VVNKWWEQGTSSELFSLDLYVSDFIDFRQEVLYKNKLFLQENLLKKGKSILYLAKEIGCSRHTLNNHVKQLSIEIPPPKSSRRNPHYGQKRVKGQLVEHLGERRVIEMVLRLNREGLSLPQICRYLESLGIPTKKNKLNWAPSQVWRILKNYKK